MALTDAELSRLGKRFTMTNAVRRGALIAALKRVESENVAGDIVECGVWQGGNIIIARTALPERTCWLYDTFNGMTAPDAAIDVNRSGRSAAERYEINKMRNLPWCSASIERVRENLKATGTLDESKLRFIVGDVAETLKKIENRPERIALLRLDTDWYASTMAELEMLYPLLSPGGILIVDDYGHWRGAQKAVDEYFAAARPQFAQIDYSAIMAVKPC